MNKSTKLKKQKRLQIYSKLQKRNISPDFEKSKKINKKLMFAKYRLAIRKNYRDQLNLLVRYQYKY